MRRITYAGLLLCLMSISSIASAQTEPPVVDAWPAVPSPEQPTAPTWEPSTPPSPLPSALVVQARDTERPPRNGSGRSSRSSSNVAPTGPVHEQWYGWQTLLVDLAGLAVGLIELGGNSDGSPLFGGVYFLGGPIVHFAHGHVGRGFGSLVLRLLMPLPGVLVGAAASLGCAERGDEPCTNAPIVIGGGLGMLGAIIINAAVLAYEDVPDEDPAALYVSMAIDDRSVGLAASGMF